MSSRSVNIIGIHIGHDASIALLVNGTPQICVSEERLNRQKSFNGFPSRALRFVMESRQLTSADIDIVALDTMDMPQTVPIDELHTRLSPAEEDCQKPLREHRISFRGDQTVSETLLERGPLGDPRSLVVARCLRVRPDRVRIYDHHYCHAVSAFDASPFESATFITSDARGDGKSATIGRAAPRQLEIATTVPSQCGVGQFYGAATAFLGFRPNRHEGKLTGLAAHGNPEVVGELFGRQITWTREGSYAFALPAQYSLSSYNSEDEFLKALDLDAAARSLLAVQASPDSHAYKARWLGMRAYLRDVAARHKPVDVAAGVQLLVERATLGLLARHHRDKGPVVCAGGVFSNVKLNQLVLRHPRVSDMFIQPAMGDEGLALGSAFAAWREVSAHVTKSGYTGHTYLGPEFSDGEVVAACRMSGVALKRMNDDSRAQLVANALHSGAIVGLFQGPMEFGPRALGNRTILASGRSRTKALKLNQRLERSEFMPFGPAILEECASSMLTGYRETHAARTYMTVSYQASTLARRLMPGAVHVDGSVRPQVVTKRSAPFLHLILAKYFALCGVPAVINTSMNRHEDPIVCTPAEALKLYNERRLDLLILNGYVIGDREERYE